MTRVKKMVAQRFWGDRGYDDIRFYRHHTMDGFHAVLKFPNGYGVSILTKGYRQFEVAEVRIVGTSWQITEAGVLMYSASKDELMELVKKTMEADSE
jgi:hypothetical protein